MLQQGKQQVVIIVKPSTSGFNIVACSLVQHVEQYNTNEYSELIQYFNEEEYPLINFLLKEDIDLKIIQRKQNISGSIIKRGVTFLPNNKIVYYPIKSKNLEIKIRKNYISDIFQIDQNIETIDLTFFEEEKKFLEGNLSVIYDHSNKIAFAAISEKTNE